MCKRGQSVGGVVSVERILLAHLVKVVLMYRNFLW